MISVDISVIILTFNEEIHIQRCIDSVREIAAEIWVVDCFSLDRTKELAEKSGAKVVQWEWPGTQARQLNRALAELPLKSKWILRLDADEYITPELADEIRNKLPGISEEVSGIVLPLRRVFLGRTIRRGTGQIKILRIFRAGKAICEERWMDEHMQLLEGTTIEFDHEFADHNLNTLGWWTSKHNGYSIREAIDLLDIELGLFDKNDKTSELSPQAAQKRHKKEAYARQPLFWRSFAYFIYRYFFRLGFLEGKEGFLWHFLQGWWYRTLVDAKIYEIKRACGTDKQKIREYIRVHYGIKLD